MNLVQYIGRLTKDNELNHSQSGTAYIRNSIAVDRKFKREGEPTADFFNFTLLGKGAEIFAKYTKKGSKVYIAGRNQNSNYTSKTGEKHYETTLMVEEFEFLDTKDKEEKSDGFVNVPDNVDDLPFE